MSMRSLNPHVPVYIDSSSNTSDALAPENLFNDNSIFLFFNKSIPINNTNDDFISSISSYIESKDLSFKQVCGKAKDIINPYRNSGDPLEKLYSLYTTLFKRSKQDLFKTSILELKLNNNLNQPINDTTIPRESSNTSFSQILDIINTLSLDDNLDQSLQNISDNIKAHIKEYSNVDHDNTVSMAYQKLDDLNNSILTSSIDNTLKKKYNILINWFKMQIYMINKDIPSYLLTLLNLFLSGQISSETKPLIISKINDDFHFFFDDLNRTTVIDGLSYDSILDFCTAKINGKKVILFLTKEGLFQSEQTKFKKFNSTEMKLVNLDSFFMNIFKENNAEKVKISFSFEILYVFCIESKTIHEVTSFAENKGENIKSIHVSIPDHPVISFNYDAGCLKIVQQQSCSLEKTTLLLTIIPINDKTTQTQSIIEIENNDNQPEITDVLFKTNFMFILRNGSSKYEKWEADSHFTYKKEKNLSFNFYVSSQSKQKVDFNSSSFLVLEPIKNNEKFGVSIHNSTSFFTEDTELFIEYPFIQHISNIANNNLQAIFNNFNQGLAPEYKQDMIPFKKDFLKIDYIKEVKTIIMNLNDEKLKVFFYSVYIKFFCINLCSNFENYFSSNAMNEDLFATIKSFILDLYPSKLPTKLDLIVKESVFSIISIFGKCLFLPNVTELSNFVNQMLSNDQKMIQYFSEFFFLGPSSIYLMNPSIYQQLKKLKINLSELFQNNISYLFIYSKDTYKFKIPYIDALLDHLRFVLSNEPNSISVVMNIVIYLFYYDFSDLNFSIELEKRLISFCKVLYSKINEVPEVLENDKKFANLDLTMFSKEIYEEKQFLEVDHSTFDRDKVYKFIFNPKVNKIRIRFDKSSLIKATDVFCCTSDNEIKFFRPPRDVHSPKHITIHSNKVNITIGRYDTLYNKWKVKIRLTGIHNPDSNIWLPNIYLFFYNYYLFFLFSINSSLYNSTPIENIEKEFYFILDNEIIQGIKIEEIDQYEKELNKQNDNENNTNNNVRKISRGISRGINYNLEDNDEYDAKDKKIFIMKLISKNKEARLERFLSFIYSRIISNNTRLNQVNEKIMEIENYFTACLLKQLGLISTCIKFMNVFSFTRKNDLQNLKIPNQILLVWKKVFQLRKDLLFKKQKTRLGPDESAFEKYLLEIKRKCTLLLYSDSILYLKYRNNLNNEKIDSAMKSIYSFVISEIPLEKISDLIDIRRKRLLISNESLLLISSFIDQNLLLESSKPIFANYCKFEPLLYKLKGLKKSELKDYYDSFGNLSVNIIQKIFNNLSFIMIHNSSSLIQPLFEHENDESKIKCSQLLIDLLEKNKNNTSFYKSQISFNLILLLLAIISQTKSASVFDFTVSLLSNDSFEFNSKYLILYYIPYYISLIPENTNVLDENLVMTLLSNNQNIPTIIKLLIEWLAYIFISTDENETKHHDFILKVLKGIGYSFVGKSCLLIDESYQPFTHRQVAESMITFIRLLFNAKNNIFETIAHDILTNKIKNVQFDNEEDLIILIGLFASIGSEISSATHDRKIINNNYRYKNWHGNANDISFMKSNVIDNKILSNVYTNSISIHPSQFDLNENEIENILQLHNDILNSIYKNDRDYEKTISQSEIINSMLIATFYSFIPIIMQNENNAEILLNDKNLSKSMPLFDFSKEKLQSNENLIIFLSHFLERAISSPIYITPSRKIEDVVDSNGSFRFLKLNAGVINYNQNGSKDTITTDPSQFNVFVCNRPFLSTRETYFEIKINQVGSQNIFIGFIDSGVSSVLYYAYGFGSLSNQKSFCRRANFLSKGIDIINDNVMTKEENKIEIKNGDSIGCYFTQDFIYLTINGKLTPYRLFHTSLKSYLPLIFVDHDNITFEINHNTSIVDNSSNDKFEFLKNISENYFEPYDFESIKTEFESEQKQESKINELPLIGSHIYINELAKDEYRNNHATIKDIKENKMQVEAYNSKMLSTEMIEIDIDQTAKNTTYLFYIVENITNTKLSYNASLDMSCLPDYLQIDPDLNKIKNYLKNRTIKENSRSIAVIMTRYLVFILVDYLRYSKSKLLQEEGIKTNEMQNIIKSLAYSLPTITSLSTVLSYNVPKNYGNYLVFNDNDNNSCLPGLYIYYNSSFKAFLKQSEKFISPQFYIDLLQSLFDISNQNDSMFSASSLYEMIEPAKKFESVYPLPKSYNSCNTLIKLCKPIHAEKCNIIAAVPILLHSIPDNLPCVKFSKKTLRFSSDQISYLESVDFSKSSSWFSWEFHQNSDYIRDYRLKLGAFLLLNKLDQRFLDGHFGFIQILIIFLSTFNPSDRLMKEKLNLMILDKLFEISEKRNPLIYPFIKPMILILTSVYDFSNVLLTKKAERVFSTLSYPKNDLYPMNSFPDHKNESYFIFSIYSKLIQAKNAENLLLENEIDLSKLFDVYFSINNQIFYVNNEIDSRKEEGFERFTAEVSQNKIFKDYHYHYLLLFYSILCNNDNNLPYPIFLFVHERIRQHFGGFIFTKRFVVHPRNDINIDGQLYAYNFHIANRFDLECSFKHINYTRKSSDSMLQCPYLVYIKQLIDNKIIEIHQSTSVTVSFPIMILIKVKDENEQRSNEGVSITFSPSKNQQKEYFINHYEEIKRDFQTFISFEPSFDISRFDSIVNIKSVEFDQIRKTDSNDNNEDIKILKRSILLTYINLFGFVNTNYASFGSFSMIASFMWNIPLIRHNDKLRLYSEQVTKPLKYLDTQFKIKIINLLNRSSNRYTRGLYLKFNRFEAQEFKKSFEQSNNESSSKKFKPLFIQLISQVPIKSIPQMKITGSNPFHVSLVSELGVDAGGPGREVFSNIIVEMMNDRLGIFTMNPNMRNQLKDTNREDLIPNKLMRNDIYQYENDTQFQQRLIYAGALIAICINSNLPQQMDLAPFIWEFLLNSSVSIESIYEIDNEFKNFIQNAEDLLSKLSNSQKEAVDEIESNLMYSFEIMDSFGSLVDLIPSGSKKNVTKDNLNEFIELAKDYRIHEFDDELNALKTGFNMIINNYSFLGILNSKELKMLACGEKECKISRMKELFEIHDNGPENLSAEKIEIFWKVMESFSVHERLLFIRFSSGYMGLPAEGLDWPRKLNVIFQSENESLNSFGLPYSHTCFLSVSIPIFKSEEELACMLRLAINSCECYGSA